jgi:agmatinase
LEEGCSGKFYTPLTANTHFPIFVQKSKMEKSFNPSAAASIDTGVFGLPCKAEQAQIILIPVNWELTVSYGKGTFEGPEAIYNASMQMDLYNHDHPKLWEKGIWMDRFPDELKALHNSLKPDAAAIIRAIESGQMDAESPHYIKMYQHIAKGAERLNNWLAGRIAFWKKQGKIVGLVGGDHSTPLGYHTYLAGLGQEYGILTIDAHLDLRRAYEGFEYSHASIFYNVLKYDNVSRIVHVGIRDYCHEEVEFIEANSNRVQVFYDRELRKQLFEGRSWKQLTDQIIAALPQKVYISIDIDGLDPKLCPHTGTPVPGGLQFEEMMFLLNRLKSSGKEIVGFDLCEVAPNLHDEKDEWDGNVGARVLFQLCGTAS